MLNEESLRPTVLEVNLNNFKHNVNQIQTYVGNDVKLMPVIKAAAYGTYINKCLDVVNEFDIVAVAVVDEAIELRKLGYEKEIFVLNQADKNAGVKNFDKFHNSGYKGLYNGETADDIAKRKGLRYREDILDNMGSEELAANLFRITQTESKLKRDNISTEKEANKTHYNIGKNIREVIAKNGGTMPEDLPTPKKSLKQLEKENKKSLAKTT